MLCYYEMKVINAFRKKDAFQMQSLHLIGHSRVLIIREHSAYPQYCLVACSCICAYEGTQALISDKKETHKQEENDLSPHKLACTHYISQ